MCSLRDAATGLGELGVKVLGVSLDDVQSQKAFAKEHELAYPLLSDADGSVADRYDVLMQGGFARRVTFVVDPEGTVRLVDRRVRVATHGEDLAAAIRSLRDDASGD